MMQEQDRNLAEKRASVIKALAHPSRIYIVARLSSGDASVGELVDDIGSDVSTVSKHLSILKRSGLLADRKEGNRVLYSLRCPCIMEFIHCIDDIIVEDAERGLACVRPTMKKTLAAMEET